MNEGIQEGPVEEAPSTNFRDDAVSLLQWFKTEARPFFEKHAPEVLPPLDNDANRLEKIQQTGKSYCVFSRTFRRRQEHAPQRPSSG